MRSLVVHNKTAGGVFNGFVFAWAAVELLSRVPRFREGMRRSADPTFFIVGVSIYGGVSLGFLAARHRLWMFGGGWLSIVVGLTVFVSGVTFRLWAMANLGRLFTFHVMLQPGHRVVTSGPYRLLRHPSYTGALIALLGLGIALESGLAVLAFVGVPLIGFLIRIAHEERTLRAALGADYEAYAARTSRLIPGVW